MSDLNAHSDRMVLIIGCSVKKTGKFKKQSKDRAAKYVYDLKEQNSISYDLLGAFANCRDATIWIFCGLHEN